MHGDSHSCDGPSGLSLQPVDPDAYVDALMHGELKPSGLQSIGGYASVSALRAVSATCAAVLRMRDAVWHASKGAGWKACSPWVVAICHCALSMARRAVFIVVNVFVVFIDCYGCAGDSAVWTVRPRPP
ncbi:MAG: hypothetical protein K2K75_10425 [Muribaculaceae bacterium]|nr:hypothetical protein [Muribaculaceae bacterium]